MVRIPTAGNIGLGQIQTTKIAPAYQNLNVNSDMFGAQIGRDFERLGSAISKSGEAYQKIIDEQAKADAYTAMNKSDDDIRKTHYDPENGIYSRKGAMALTAYKDSQEAIDDIYSKNSENLNSFAKQKYSEMWAQKRNSILNSSARFEAQQRQVYKNDSTNALVNNSIDDAIKQYNNPEAVRENANLIDYVLKDSIGELPKDATPEMIVRQNELFREKRKEAFDKIHSGIISKLASNGQVDIAKKYYKKVKNEVSALNQIKIDAMLKEGTLRGDSQREFDKISSSGKTEAEQLQDARNIKDPELRDAVEARVKSSWKDPKSLEQEKISAIKNESWNQIVNGTKPEEIPLQMWTSIDKKTRDDMTNYSLNGAPKQSDAGTYFALNDRLIKDSESFKTTNLLDYITKLSDEDFKYFLDHQKQILNGDLTKSISIRTFQAIANDRLSAIGIDTTADGNSRDKKRTATFYRSLTGKIEDFTKRNRREPKDEEVEQIIDGMLIKGEVKETELKTGFFGTDSRFAFEGDFETFTIEDINDVPDNYRRIAKNILEKKGYIANDENIIRMVNEFLKNNRQ